MAMKIICDGCGVEEIVPEGTIPTKVTIIPVTIDGDAVDYDLCLGCLVSLREKADPRNWPRVGKGT